MNKSTRISEAKGWQARIDALGPLKRYIFRYNPQVHRSLVRMANVVKSALIFSRFCRPMKKPFHETGTNIREDYATTLTKEES